MNPSISYINRSVEHKIKVSLNQGKIVVVYGARQTGKTTMVKNLFKKNNYLYLACEEKRIREQLLPDFLSLKKVIGDYKNIVIDEAQTLENPGMILKILIDNDPKLNIIATGSSSFDLSNKLNEPLTGRHYQFLVYPFSYQEIAKVVSPPDINYTIKNCLIYGSYPGIFTQTHVKDRINLLQTLTTDYLYKDILNFELIKDSNKIKDLLVALALQLGQEVSYFELANTLGIDQKTVERYLDLLEKCFIILRLRTFSRNLRSEINRKVKIYFYDLGIRNSLLNNFTPLELRTDSGALFENYFIIERIKSYQEKERTPNYYFWRTYSQQEIDFIEEQDGMITGFEVKFNPKKKLSKTTIRDFTSAYSNSNVNIVNLENFQNFL